MSTAVVALRAEEVVKAVGTAPQQPRDTMAMTPAALKRAMVYTWERKRVGGGEGGGGIGGRKGGREGGREGG